MTSQALTCRDYESGVLSQCRLLVKHNPLTCTVFLVQLVGLGFDGVIFLNHLSLLLLLFKDGTRLRAVVANQRGAAKGKRPFVDLGTV